MVDEPEHARPRVVALAPEFRELPVEERVGRSLVHDDLVRHARVPERPAELLDVVPRDALVRAAEEPEHWTFEGRGPRDRRRPVVRPSAPWPAVEADHAGEAQAARGLVERVTPSEAEADREDVLGG